MEADTNCKMKKRKKKNECFFKDREIKTKRIFAILPTRLLSEYLIIQN